MLCSTHKNGGFGACHVFFDSKDTTPTPHTVLVTYPFDFVGEAGIIRATAQTGVRERGSGHALVFNVAIAGFVLQGETEVTAERWLSSSPTLSTTVIWPAKLFVYSKKHSL